jgi:hypothetical protein
MMAHIVYILFLSFIIGVFLSLLHMKGVISNKKAVLLSALTPICLLLGGLLLINYVLTHDSDPYHFALSVLMPTILYVVGGSPFALIPSMTITILAVRLTKSRNHVVEEK